MFSEEIDRIEAGLQAISDAFRGIQADTPQDFRVGEAGIAAK
jgi:hypothetical protein